MLPGEAQQRGPGVRRVREVVHGLAEPLGRTEDVGLAMEDVPFDRDTGEVLYLPKPAQIRQFPALTVKVTLLAVEPDGMRELAHYAFHHQPWQGGAQPPS